MKGETWGVCSRSGEGSDCHLYWASIVCQVMGFVPILPGLSHPVPTPALCQCYYPALTEKETETQRHYVSCPRSHSLLGVEPGSQPRFVCLQWILLAARKSSSWKSRSGVGVFSQSSSGSPEANLLSSALLLLTHLPGKSQVSPPPRPLPQPQVLAQLCLTPRLSLVPQGGSEVTHTPMPSILHFQIKEG